MKFLILGASGLVGGNCLKYFTEQGHDVLGTHFSFETEHTQFFNTLDLDDENNADVDGFAPDIIVHCGALTWVDYCEENEEESYQKTVQSTLNAIEISKKHNAKLVYLSTDYVFDGKKGLYAEVDDVNPLGVYAKHKLASEQAIQASGVEHLICRITNVYGDEIRGKNFVSRLSENMRKGEAMELKLPSDQYATPVNAWDVARAILKLVAANKSGIYHFAATDYLNRIELAEQVIGYFGHEQVSLIPVTTEQLNQLAPRPLLGGMNASKFNAEFPDFRWSNVDDYLKKLKKRYE
ncbi:MAG: SDR family oxidoreductase [Flavobacteriales bacterium]|jgi:dTDP-4-dehydrorhamnose reductase|nr:SDR family oxidoreductase [Flavobacteriales bacterium]NCG30822.1 sugar nucleotide-binding protein [Bacteroidota bacterium]MBT3963129.1 SDR family oxidoreductase [Flavobacteriales bacterium]MBT4704162.1 SDR family oxidoreductase [Flavobacteriales bacterium]MBT4930018.1 SDR family oxidoreductase [Flavobacteriales bacterium]